VDIYGARDDIVIPIHHAQTLAAQVKGSHFHLIECGHNEWAERRHVDLR
jgi:pimeloyl-ACP methyl ester carboxylesterase